VGSSRFSIFFDLLDLLLPLLGLRHRRPERLSTAAGKFSRASDADFHQCPTHRTASLLPQSRPIGKSKEIAARVARFRAMQQKFKREREEFFRGTIQNARDGN